MIIDNMINEMHPMRISRYLDLDELIYMAGMHAYAA